MRLQPAAIKLGTLEWLIRPLTLRQVQEIEPFVMDNALGGKSNIAAAMAIVDIALRRDHPEAAAQLLDIEATAPQIGQAMAIVLRLGGFIESGSSGGFASGEEEAGVSIEIDTPASISGKSMPA